MKLRDYQQYAVNSVYSYFSAGGKGNPIVVLPTGAGKSLVIAELMRSALELDGDQRFIMASHVKELIEQNHQKLRTIWPQAPSGIYSTGIGLKQPNKAIVCGGIQSMYKKAHIFGHRDLLIIDECHMLPPSGEGMYNTFIKELKKINPRLKIIGLSATPFRMKGGHLIHGGVFTDICYDVSINVLIERGYLSPLIGKSSPVQADMKGVRLTAGEFNQKQAQERFNQDELIYKALNDVFARASDRKSFLFFCAGVEHSENVHRHLQRRGKRGAVVTGETPKLERERHIERLRNGDYDYLCNNAVLTTGTDIPRIDCVVLFRATKSRGLYMQILGRGMRLFNGKENCLVLDYGGNMQRFGAIDQQPDMSKPREGCGDAPFKICENNRCRTSNHASARQCEKCGQEFIFEEKPAHEEQASDGVLFSHEIKNNNWHDVGDVLYNVHQSAITQTPTIKVTYCDLMGKPIANEFVCAWHSGGARARALNWLIRAEISPIIPNEPHVLCDALRRTAKIPKRIETKKNGKHKEVINYDFTKSKTLHDRSIKGSVAHYGAITN